jgi:hypothetical protein
MLKRYKMEQVDSFEYTLPDPKKPVKRRLIVIGKQSVTGVAHRSNTKSSTVMPE